MLALVLAYTPHLVPSFGTQSSTEPVSLAPSIGLVGGAVLVSAYLLLTRSNKQAIALPTEDEKSFIVEVDEEVDPASFYPGLRRRKLALVGFITAAFAVALFQAGWDLVNSVGTTSLVQDGLMLVFWVSQFASERSANWG